jgi:hypothetical protein
MAAGVSETLWTMEDIAERIEVRKTQPSKRGPYEKRASMGNRDWNKKTVLVFDRGRHVDSIRRVVFGDLGGYGIEPRPDATGQVNYRGAIATVHRDP